MKPTKEQLADPKWWDENTSTEDKYCYHDKKSMDWLTSWHLDESMDRYELLAKRPEPEWVPEVGVECCGNTTDAAGNWSWQKVEPLKNMGNGEFACYTENKILRFVDQFRPIKTQREELIDIVAANFENAAIADAILARFDLTGKDDK